MKRKFYTAIVFFLAVCMIFPSLSACSQKVEEDPKAEFSTQTKMFATDGISIIMDMNFKKYYPEDCSLAAENGDLKFEAFYLEKYYFKENGRNINSDIEALEYVNPGKDTGAKVELNYLWQPYVEFLTPDPKGTQNDIRMYYVCVEGEEEYWFCTFFCYDKNFEEYRPKMFEYLESLRTYTE